MVKVELRTLVKAGCMPLAHPYYMREHNVTGCCMDSLLQLFLFLDNFLENVAIFDAGHYSEASGCKTKCTARPGKWHLIYETVIIFSFTCYGESIIN